MLSSDEQQPADTPPPDSGAPDEPLGYIDPGPRDRRLDEPRPATSHRKQAPAAAATSPSGQPAPPDLDPLRLPRGGLVSMRQSGGLRFRSRELAVYRSGKLVYRQLVPAGTEAAGTTRHVPLAELVQLHHLLSGLDFSRLPDAGLQNSETYTYEIVARVGRAMRFATAAEGSIPPALAPLIRELRHLMPEE